MDRRYRKTMLACFIGHVVQAVVNNFAPLLFLTFQNQYDISWSRISALITINFCVQLSVDLMGAAFVDRLGYRAGMLLAHGASALGLAGLAVLPDLMPAPFLGLVICVTVYAIGGGILEVLVSPMVESCPTENKEGAMGLLHSFYCWGHAAVVLLSTVFFTLACIENWRILALLWALLPLCNGIAFLFVPIVSPESTGHSGMGMGKLLRSGLFWGLLIMMLCSGASEQGISQWASAFAEKALRVPKAVGDLAGPLSFALLMGTTRALYARFSRRIRLEKALLVCGFLCIVSYLLASLSPNPVLSFVGCALCGFSVALLWPGIFSIGSAQIPLGGTAMFALMALAGDLGCSLGPSLIGTVSDAVGGDLKAGTLAGVIFPLGLVTVLLLRRRKGMSHNS